MALNIDYGALANAIKAGNKSINLGIDEKTGAGIFLDFTQDLSASDLAKKGIDLKELQKQGLSFIQVDDTVKFLPTTNSTNNPNDNGIGSYGDGTVYSPPPQLGGTATPKAPSSGNSGGGGSVDSGGTGTDVELKPSGSSAQIGGNIIIAPTTSNATNVSAPISAAQQQNNATGATVLDKQPSEVIKRARRGVLANIKAGSLDTNAMTYKPTLLS